MLGYIKGYDIKTISKFRAKKAEFGFSLESQISALELQRQVLEALSTGGRVYGVFKKKEMAACYIFRKEKVKESDFIGPQIDLSLDNAWEFLTRGTVPEGEKERNKDNAEVLLQKEVDIYKLCNYYVLPEHKEVIPEFEKAILAELKELMLWGEIKGAVWEEKILVNKQVNVGGAGSFAGIPFGIAMGVTFGIIFDNLALGIGLGMLWGIAMGTAFSATKSGNKAETETHQIEDKKE